MELWKLNAQDVERARSYVPMAEKAAFAERVSSKCRYAVHLGVQDNGNPVGAIPDMHMENTEKKTRYMMGALVKLYLNGEFAGVEDDELLPSLDEYDQMAGAHLLNQIERLKGDKSVRDKCFDLMQDYRTLEKIVNAELYSTLQVENDPVSRLLAFLQTATTPEKMQELTRQAEAVKTEMDAYIKERESRHENT